MGNLKVQDLEDPHQDTSSEEDLMFIRILTYSAGPEVIDEVFDLCNRLSDKDIRFSNKTLFQENGFAVGTGTLSQGNQVVRGLNQIGAVRVAQIRLMIPVDEIEFFFRIFLETPEKIQFSNSDASKRTETVGPGFLGWCLSAKPDPRYRGMAQFRIAPVFWQQGLRGFPVSKGQEQSGMQFFREGQFLVRVEEGGFVVLGPARDVPDGNTLDKRLFYLPGKRPKVRFFVIICESVES